jgi:hypothetical protein
VSPRDQAAAVLLLRRFQETFDRVSSVSDDSDIDRDGLAISVRIPVTFDAISLVSEWEALKSDVRQFLSGQGLS